MTCYYNEIDPKKAAWLRELIARDLIAPGEVDERSIADVRPDDLVRFTQCHFFAGIGVWSYALRSAGWDDTRPVWTGSCPCQPFSVAGSGGGLDDKRHLWPDWFRLIAERRPDVVFGEQVASPAGLGWLDLVSTDLEAEAYAFAPVDLCAASVGAPHIRQRLYFVADSEDADRRRKLQTQGAGSRRSRRSRSTGSGSTLFLANSESGRLGINGSASRDAGHTDERRAACHGVALGDAVCARLEGQPRNGDRSNESGRFEARPDRSATETGTTRGFWKDCDWLPCTDGKTRPVESGTFPLAHGAPARVVRLRGYGDGIVCQLA